MKFLRRLWRCITGKPELPMYDPGLLDFVRKGAMSAPFMDTIHEYPETIMFGHMPLPQNLQDQYDFIAKRIFKGDLSGDLSILGMLDLEE